MTAPPFERTRWYAVGGGIDLEAGSARAVTLLGQDLVLWREAGGAAHAWRNRCPHRGMRLSYGSVRGDRLVCRYHGWQYDGTGRCRYIPAHPAGKPPNRVCVASYPCRERHGLVWVCLEGGEDAEPDVGAAGHHLDFCRSFYLGAAPEAVRDLLAKAVFPTCALAPNDGVAYRSRSLGAGSIAVTAATAGGETETVVAAIQPVSEARTGLHLLFSLSAAGAGPGAAPGAAGKHFARWGKRLRWCIENSGAAGAESDD